MKKTLTEEMRQIMEALNQPSDSQNGENPKELSKEEQAEILKQKLLDRGHSPGVIAFEVERFLGQIEWNPIGSHLD